MAPNLGAFQVFWVSIQNSKIAMYATDFTSQAPSKIPNRQEIQFLVVYRACRLRSAFYIPSHFSSQDQAARAESTRRCAKLN
jgi:hypothetical protein